MEYVTMHKAGVPQSRLLLADFTYSYDSGNMCILIKDYEGRMCVCLYECLHVSCERERTKMTKS